MQSYSKVPVLSHDDNPIQAKARMETGYINVKESEVKVKLEDDAINRLRYLPPRDKYKGTKYKTRTVMVGGIEKVEYVTDTCGGRIEIPNEQRTLVHHPAKWV